MASDSSRPDSPLTPQFAQFPRADSLQTPPALTDSLACSVFCHKLTADSCRLPEVLRLLRFLPQTSCRLMPNPANSSPTMAAGVAYLLSGFWGHASGGWPHGRTWATTRRAIGSCAGQHSARREKSLEFGPVRVYRLSGRFTSDRTILIDLSISDAEPIGQQPNEQEKHG